MIVNNRDGGRRWWHDRSGSRCLVFVRSRRNWKCRDRNMPTTDRIKGDVKEVIGYTMLCASDRNSVNIADWFLNYEVIQAAFQYCRMSTAQFDTLTNSVCGQEIAKLKSYYELASVDLTCRTTCNNTSVCWEVLLLFLLVWLSTTFRLRVITGGHRMDGQTDGRDATLLRPRREGRIHISYMIALLYGSQHVIVAV